MSQSSASNVNNNHPDLDTQTIEKLRQFRELMMHRFNEHTAGNAPLPAEQSLSLRTNISNITQIIEPGTQEMWPDYTAAEKSYMAEQSANNKRAANDLGIAFLGPMAAPAILAKTLDAPPETVDKLLEFGFDMTALAGLASVGRGSANARGAIEPVRIAERMHGESSGKTRTAHIDSPASNPEAAKNKLMQNIMQSVDEVKPILEWYKNGADGQYDTGKLAVVIHKYTNQEAKIIAELESIKPTQEVINDFKTSNNGFDALDHEHNVTMKFVESISTNNAIDPTKLANTLKRIEEGSFLTITDFAALENARSNHHEFFVNSRTAKAVSEAVKSGVTSKEELAIIKAQAKMVSEENSPYQLPKDAGNEIPPPEPGPER